MADEKPKTTAVAKPKATPLKALINQENVAAQIARALPAHLSADRFLRIATTALSKTPKLQNTTPESFMRCLLDLSSLGLEPDGRRAYLIPYGTDCTLIIGYQGLVDLVRRSGEVSDIHADVVCENDEFVENLGQVEIHRIDRRKPRGKVIAAYSRVVMKDGAVSCEVMGLDEIERVRKLSKSGDSGPWKDHFEAMARKTVFRRHSKWLPFSSEARTMIEKDDEYQVRNVTPAPNPFLSPRIAQEEPETEEEPPTPPKRRKRSEKVVDAEEAPPEAPPGPQGAVLEAVEEMSGGWWKACLLVDGENRSMRIGDEALADAARELEGKRVSFEFEERDGNNWITEIGGAE